MANKHDKEAVHDKLLLELRRGVLALAVLSRLATAEYGYSLKQELNQRGLAINEGTLYPLLRRLESQGLLESDWRVVDDARPRRYYRLSPMGETILANLTYEWGELVNVMDDLLAIDSGGSKDGRQ